MSDVPLTNEQLAALEIIPGGATFGQAAETMGLSQEEVGLPTVRDTRMPINPTFISSRYVGTGKDRVRYDLFSNGERGPFADPQDEDDDGGDTTAASTTTFNQDAFGRLRALLTRIGLSNLEGNVRDLIARGITDSDAILFELRETPTFQTRFKANVARAKKGLPELDPGTYVGLEQSFRELLRSNNLPTDFYDSPDDFAKLIEGDVSPAELQDRINQGYRKVQDADPAVKQEMQRLYGVSEQQLAAYFIDPDRGVTALKRQAEAAQIAGRGRELAGFQLTVQQAEELASRGISPEEAQARFAETGRLAGLFQPLTGEEALTTEEQLGATFGYNIAAQQALERRRAQRVGEFQTGGQFARTTGATSGTVETGVGTAQ